MTQDRKGIVLSINLLVSHQIRRRIEGIDMNIFEIVIFQSPMKTKNFLFSYNTAAERSEPVFVRLGDGAVRSPYLEEKPVGDGGTTPKVSKICFLGEVSLLCPNYFDQIALQASWPISWEIMKICFLNELSLFCANCSEMIFRKSCQYIRAEICFLGEVSLFCPNYFEEIASLVSWSNLWK